MSGFSVGQAHDAKPLREAPNEQSALAGQRVDPHHGVGGFELQAGELLAALLGILVLKVLGTE